MSPIALTWHSEVLWVLILSDHNNAAPPHTHTTNTSFFLGKQKSCHLLNMSQDRVQITCKILCHIVQVDTIFACLNLIIKPIFYSFWCDVVNKIYNKGINPKGTTIYFCHLLLQSSCEPSQLHTLHVKVHFTFQLWLIIDTCLTAVQYACRLPVEFFVVTLVLLCPSVLSRFVDSPVIDPSSP